MTIFATIEGIFSLFLRKGRMHEMIHFMAFSSTNSHFYGAFLHKLCIIALILSPFFLLGCGPSAELDSKAGGAVTAESAMIAFDYVVLDTVFGHREVGDIDRDGLNDIVVGQNGEVNGKNRVYWYRSPDRERYLIADIDSHPGFNAYRACDMELADLDADGDLDVIGRIGPPDTDTEGEMVWWENPLPGGDPRSTWSCRSIGANNYAKE